MGHSFLFGNQASAQSKYLLEFKAGKMQMKGTTVKPIDKKGLVYIHRADDNLMHFCWKDRTSGQTEDDLIIFPDDTEFKKVSQCTTGRVYVLKFRSSKKVLFFWLQEPSEDKDEEICKKVNDLLNNPSASTSRSSGHNLITDLPESEIHNLINNVNPSQLMQILSRVNGVSTNQLANLLNQSGSSKIGRHSGSSSRSSSSKASSNNSESSSRAAASSTTASAQSPATTNTPTAAQATGNAPASAIQLSDLQNIILGLNVQGKKEKVNVELGSIVNSEALKSLLGNKDFMDKVNALLPNISEAGQPEASLPEQLTSTIESVQFKSALSSFNSAFNSGLLAPLLQQFNMSDECIEAANKGDLEAFVKAIESSAKKSSGNKDKKEIEDSDMAYE